MEGPSSGKRVRDDSDESGLESPEVKRLRDDLLDLLDDTDPALSSQDLDSVMKSLQEEISASSSPAPAVDLTSDSGDSQPQIGYLLEASDDELGLPPPGESVNPDGKGELPTELIPALSDSSGIAELWEFENQIPSYDSFDLGTGAEYNGNSAEYLAFDGLFDHSDVYYDSAELAESWRHETLPAQ
ncbi:uncharacterized protein LOC129311870 [Prosopis cineraria]|uniref:uncharacterized protein LOC129311843 n=1 Tax=Prosopis cineraria TaxID=364024 RepID=UPI00240EAA58|nr:uncharacterized protein LOC129311843 [Prosopis cineraria]XP_054810314.1 uncharacterized protein LOC129311870 [Prosopis cineraria]